MNFTAMITLVKINEKMCECEYGKVQANVFRQLRISIEKFITFGLGVEMGSQHSTSSLR
jgi:hypothetical protein